MTYTNDCSDKAEKIKELIGSEDAVIIGAGAGLSTASGFTYSGERFHKYFHDFEVKYNFHDMYTGGFYPYGTPEEYWAFWSRYILINRYTNPPKPLYDQLLNLVKDKNYFVITTNVDHCFQKAGFDKNRLFYTQGDYGLFQCSVPCKQITYDNEAIIRKMVAEQKNMKIPTESIPRCPVCGRPLIPNLRCDDKFVEDDGWKKAYENYKKFLKKNKGKRILFLELGVGMNTPSIIKYPFIRMTAENPNAFYVCINKDFALVPDEIKNRSLCISGDIAEVISNR